MKVSLNLHLLTIEIYNGNEIMLNHTYRNFFARLEDRAVSFFDSSGVFKSING